MINAEEHADMLMELSKDDLSRSTWADVVLTIQKDMEAHMDERFRFWKQCNVYIDPYIYDREASEGLWSDLVCKEE
jgi:hypothetical protein